MKASDQLRKVLELLRDPSRWHQGDFARYADGIGCSSLSTGAVAWCLRGAIHYVRAIGYAGDAPISFLASAIGTDSDQISQWNDDKDRKHEEVIDVLNKAIVLAEDNENASGTEKAAANASI